MKWTRLLELALLCLVGTGCGLKGGMEDCRKTQEAIKAELGVEAHCGFRSYSGSSGSKLTVNIKLTTTPSGEAADIKTKVNDIVKRSFRSSVDEVNVVF